MLMPYNSPNPAGRQHRHSHAIGFGPTEVEENNTVTA